MAFWARVSDSSGIFQHGLPLTVDERPTARPVYARTLTRLTMHVPEIEGVWRRDLKSGDWVVVRTRNSQYTLAVQEDSTFLVSGGWFDRTSGGNTRVGVTGCTWGGSAILTELVAAAGMFVEFSNGVRTTRIQEIQVICGATGRPH